jgi:hypothetical protein
VRNVVVLSSVVVFVCAAAAQTAPARNEPTATAACQTTTSGHRWLVAPRGLSCSDAKKIVQTLAGRKVPAAGYFPGTYQGMRCASTTRPGTKPQYIACGTKNRSKFMVAFQQ